MIADADFEDAQCVALAIVSSLLADPDRQHPGVRTCELLQAALHGRFENETDIATANANRTRAVLFLTADIASGAIQLLTALGVDVTDQIVSPYLLDAIA